MPLLLIRHAHAGSRKDWNGPDRLRPLSPRGQRQAEALIARLKPWPPASILSSPYLRCVQTVEPLAKQLARPIEETDSLAEGAGRLALRLVRSLPDQDVALCTHGDVIPDILLPLAAEYRLDVGPSPKQAKGSTWVLVAKRGRFVEATYLPPLP